MSLRECSMLARMNQIDIVKRSIVTGVPILQFNSCWVRDGVHWSRLNYKLNPGPRGERNQSLNTSYFYTHITLVFSLYVSIWIVLLTLFLLQYICHFLSGERENIVSLCFLSMSNSSTNSANIWFNSLSGGIGRSGSRVANVPFPIIKRR